MHLGSVSSLTSEIRGVVFISRSLDEAHTVQVLDLGLRCLVPVHIAAGCCHLPTDLHEHVPLLRRHAPSKQNEAAVPAVYTYCDYCFTKKDVLCIV